MLAAFLAVVLVMAFSVVPVQAASKRIVKSVSVSKSRLSLNEGETASVKATVKSTKKAAAKDLGVKIKSSNKSVAAAKIAKKPSGKGTKGVSTIQITAKKAGTAKITVTASQVNKKGKKVQKTIMVTVKALSGKDPAPTPNPTLTPDPTPDPAPDPTPDPKVTWSVTEESFMGAYSYKDEETGEDQIIPKKLTRKYVSFSPWPTTDHISQCHFQS